MYMKKTIREILPLMLALFCLTPVFGAGEVKTLPGKYDGSMMPYDFARCDTAVAWGDSLTPFYIGYVARHGARFLSSPKKIEKLSKELYAAAMKKKLTPGGERFFAMMKEISSNTEGRWGLLSQVGIEEEERLGADMARMFSEMFRNGRVEAISTSVPRVIMTMDQFLHSLERRHQNLELYTASGKQNDSLLCCFIADTLYASYRHDGDWVPIYEEYLKKHVSDAPARRLLAVGYENDRQRLRHLTMDMYGMLQACRASGVSAPTTEWMSEEEYRGCWLASNFLHYLRNNINPVSMLAGQASVPLLKRIIHDGDDAVQSGFVASSTAAVRMHGYFGHAETLLPLFSLMRLPGCYSDSEDYGCLQDEWQIQEITPLGANLAVILLRSGSGVTYASLRLNGRNIAPLPGKGPVVKWSELTDYWTSLADAAEQSREVRGYGI